MLKCVLSYMLFILGEYYRPGWTFHAKGIWLFASTPPSPATTTTTASSPPTTVTSAASTTATATTPQLAVTYLGHDSPR